MKKSELRQLIREEIKNIREDWWSDMDSAEQEKYIQDHPKSQKALQAKKEKDIGSKEKRKSSDEPKSSEINVKKAMKKWNSMSEEAQEAAWEKDTDAITTSSILSTKAGKSLEKAMEEKWDNDGDDIHWKDLQDHLRENLPEILPNGTPKQEIVDDEYFIQQLSNNMANTFNYKRIAKDEWKEFKEEFKNGKYSTDEWDMSDPDDYQFLKDEVESFGSNVWGYKNIDDELKIEMKKKLIRAFDKLVKSK